ncbi:GPRNNA13 [Trypoxylus dichotomus]
MATSYAVQYLNTFAHALLNWTMGEIMCFLIPFLQLFGVVASSGAILIIALDRYRSAVHATMNRWNPNIMLCLFGITLLWCTAAALAYPSQILILYRKVIIVSTDDDGNQSYMDGYICITTEKYNVIVYYASITIIVFLPLVVMVLWLYYNICKLVWNQKKPKIDSGAKVQSSNDTTRSILKNSQSNIITAPQRRNFQNERRIRIFKIMILLILAFIVCRMPHWIYRTIKASYNYVDNQEWVTAFVLSSLIFLNCILNPFLYTFLPETITKIAKIWKTISNFTCEVCCCCCSNSEFEQFEKENPFSVENYDREKRINKQPNKDVRVKFEDTSTVQCNTNKY